MMSVWEQSKKHIFVIIKIKQSDYLIFGFRENKHVDIAIPESRH